jgi:hypothetical protein
MAPEKVFPGKHGPDGTPEWTSYYCRGCNAYLHWGAWAGDIIVWITCDRCLARQAEEEAEKAKEAARRELWQERLCAAADCDVAFVPRQSTQRFCSDPCRWRAHRQQKALAAASRNGA